MPFITFPVLVWLVDGAAAGRLGGVLAAATAGWWFGFGYFLAGLYWVGHAFLVDAKTFGWLLPFAVVGLAGGSGALTPRSALALARLIWTRGAARVLALAVALTLANGCAAICSRGFPWNAYGYALTSPLVLAQGASLIGIWGLTFLAVAVYASPGGARRRPGATPAALAGAGAERRIVLAALGDLRRAAAARNADRRTSTACGFASCSRTCSRTRSSTTRRSSR